MSSTLSHRICILKVILPTSEARVEFGEQVACRLKLTKDGTRVLWPQPSDDPEDPQNVENSSSPPSSPDIDDACSGQISARVSSF